MVILILNACVTITILVVMVALVGHGILAWWFPLVIIGGGILAVAILDI